MRDQRSGTPPVGRRSDEIQLVVLALLLDPESAGPWSVEKLARERECQINGGCAWWVYLILPSNAIANAFSAGFHRIAQRAFPRPVGSRALVAR